MSSSPNNPFDGPGNRTEAPPQRKSNVWLWVLGIVGVLGLLVILGCCGSVFFAYQFGAGMIGEQVKSELRGNPVVQEHIGDIESAEMNLTATAQETQDQPGGESIVFDLEGSKGSAKVAIQQGPGGEITSAVLIMPDGTRHQAVPLEDLELEMDDINTGEPQPDDLAEPDAEPAAAP